MKYLGLEFTPISDTKLDEKAIERFEQQYEITMPDDLKNLFLLMNDSILDYPVVKIDCEADFDEVMPERWTGIAPEGMNHLLDFYGSSLGEGILPFAVDPGGSIFAIRMADKLQNGVFYIDIEDYDKGLGRYASYRVASDIREFVSKILIADESPENTGAT